MEYIRIMILLCMISGGFKLLIKQQLVLRLQFIKQLVIKHMKLMVIKHIKLIMVNKKQHLR